MVIIQCVPSDAHFIHPVCTTKKGVNWLRWHPMAAPIYITANVAVCESQAATKGKVDCCIDFGLMTEVVPVWKAAGSPCV